MAQSDNDELRKLPGVDTILLENDITSLIATRGLPLVTYAVRSAIEQARAAIKGGKKTPDQSSLIRQVSQIISTIAEPSLKPVVNATGIVLHTNLGRAPLGKKVLEDISPIILGYSNLEYDLETGKRGDRGTHCVELIKYLTDVEDAAIVNNNAAAVILVLSTFAKKKEVIVSRGELIEIGGAFRIPEVMAASGCKMVEVGTTNRTRLSDYENAITDKTAILFKAHKSNYSMKGFVEEVSVKDLSDLAHKKSLMMVYDIGSGLLRKPATLSLEQEPDVVSAINDGTDLVTFSGDKLLGGPQAGIIAGQTKLVRALAKAPLMRALRPGKLTIASLSAVLRLYLDDKKLLADNPAFSMLSSSIEVIQKRAEKLLKLLQSQGINTDIINNTAQCGGGTLPDLEIPSRAVMLIAPESFKKNSDKYAEKIFKRLLTLSKPVVGILREGKILFDVVAVFDEDIEYLAQNIVLVTETIVRTGM